MGLAKYLKGTAALLTVAALAFALNGCGGGKKKAEKFSVSVDQLPAGVVSVIKPKPNKETLFVQALLQETIRRNQVAMLYNEALIHYDPKKGNAKDHERLLKKTKEAWKSARDSASVAMFYAIGLSRLERTEGYDPYAKSKALLLVPEIHLIPVAYAKENKKLNTKEEVFSKYNAKEIKNDLQRVPEGKQLLAISKMYHTSGSTAIDIMNTVNPDYTPKGRSWEDITADVAYRSQSVARTGLKILGLGAAAAATTASAPAVAILGGIAFTATLVDTGLSAVQTSLVVINGDPDKDLEKIQAYTGVTSTVLNLFSSGGKIFDLSKPIFGKDIKNLSDNVKLGIKIGEYAKTTAKGLKETVNYASAGELKNAALMVNLEGVNNATNFYPDVKSFTENTAVVKNDFLNLITGKKAVTASTHPTDDGKSETRTGLLSTKDKGKMTDKEKEEEKEKLKALGITEEEFEKAQKEAKENRAAAATMSSKDLEKNAEEVANAGGAGDYKNMFDTFVESTRQGLIESILGPGGNIHDLDKFLSEAAGEEMVATNVIVETDEKGNKNLLVVGKKKDTTPPFAPAKVAGTYKVPVNNGTVTIIVKSQGEGITLNYPYYRNNVLKHRTETPASYDSQTGKGTLVNEGSTCSFWFTNSNGKMIMGVGKWKKIKKQ